MDAATETVRARNRVVFEVFHEYFDPELNIADQSDPDNVFAFCDLP